LTLFTVESLLVLSSVAFDETFASRIFNLLHSCSYRCGV